MTKETQNETNATENSNSDMTCQWL